MSEVISVSDLQILIIEDDVNGVEIGVKTSLMQSELETVYNDYLEYLNGKKITHKSFINFINSLDKVGYLVKELDSANANFYIGNIITDPFALYYLFDNKSHWVMKDGLITRINTVCTMPFKFVIELLNRRSIIRLVKKI